jgi:hypothetical protein
MGFQTLAAQKARRFFQITQPADNHTIQRFMPSDFVVPDFDPA